MLPRYFSRRIPSRAGLPRLRSIRCVLASLLLLCVTATNLHAQTLPQGYELHPLGGGLNGAVAAVHAAGDDIYYGGDFSQAYNALDGTTPTEPVAYTNRIARWDGSQWHPLGRGTNSDVRTITSANDGSIYVGGGFTQVTQADGSTLAVKYIARFKNGQWSAVGSGVNDYVYSLAVVERPAGGHDLYVGGEFTTATDSSGTKTVNRLAKWDGSNWHALGAGVDSTVLSVVYSKARGGLYIGGWFTSANAFGSEAAVTLNRAGFWNLAEQKWQAMGDGTSGYSVATFQESSDGQSVFVSGYDIGLKRFDWNTDNWTTLSTAHTYGMQLLPDQQRLIALTNYSLQLLDISAASPAPHKLTNFYSSYILQTTATHHSGVYLGFANVDGQYHYAARLVVPDMDGDGIANDEDNCALHANNEQLNTDLDSAGDVCDICPADALDNCLENPNGDFDSDGINNADDFCPSDDTNNCLENPTADTDGDLVKNAIDNCPLTPNTDQLDSNKDGIGDACEPEQVTALSCKLKTFDNISSAETLSLSPDGRALFVGGAEGNQLTRIDTRLHTQSQTTVGNWPWAVLASRDGQRVYVANRANNTIQVLNAQTQATLATVSSSNGVSLSGPTALAESADGNYLFIANYSNNTVAVMDTQSNSLLKSISVGVNPFALQVMGSGSHETVYVANHSSNSVSVLAVGDDNLDNWQFTQTITVGDRPLGLSVDQQGYLYVTNEFSQSISVIDTASNSVISTVNLSYTPFRSHLSADGRQLYVAEWDGTGVTVIDTELARTNPAQAVLHRWANIADLYNADVHTLIGERRAYVSSRYSDKVTLLAINQLDRNGNGVGDDCDDLDNDGIIEGLDNCPGIANPDQLDGDQDGSGDVCDAFNNDSTEWLDTDNDGVGNNADICPNDPEDNCLANPAGDFDGDGFTNGAGDNKDNCPLVANTEQADFNNNGIGDACEDSDGDGVNDDLDIFPTDPTEWLDSDSDGIGDNADLCPQDALDNCLANPAGDFDGDGVNNGSDAFPEDSTEWLDSDSDGIGDNADFCPQDALNNCVNNPNADTDGDGVPNDHDAFPVDDSKWRDGDVAERLGDAAKQHFGQVIVNLGDINNDYADDYAIGTPNFKASIQVNGKTKRLNKAGKVDVISGKTGDELLSLTGSAAKALVGSAIVAADFDRDGLIDIAIGSPGANKNSGEVVICLAQADGGFTCTDTIKADASFKGSLLGASLAVAELENTTQLFVGAPKAKNADKKTVGAVVRYENDNFTNPEARFGLAVNGEYGAALAWLPQNQLLAIGAPKANKTGEVALWDVLNDEFAAPLTGIAAKEGFGRKLAVGSLADGVEHLAVAAPLAANGKLKQAGRVAVYDLAAASSEAVQTYLGLSKGEQLGASLALAAIVNGEPDSLFAGSPNFTVAKTAASKAIKKAGKVSRFMLAATDAQDEKVGTQANQQFGASLAAIELTGDFKLDVLVGSMGANNPANKKLKAAGKLELINANDWQ